MTAICKSWCGACCQANEAGMQPPALLGRSHLIQCPVQAFVDDDQSAAAIREGDMQISAGTAQMHCLALIPGIRMSSSARKKSRQHLQNVPTVFQQEVHRPLPSAMRASPTLMHETLLHAEKEGMHSSMHSSIETTGYKSLLFCRYYTSFAILDDKRVCASRY